MNTMIFCNQSAIKQRHRDFHNFFKQKILGKNTAVELVSLDVLQNDWFPMGQPRLHEIEVEPWVY